jgi:hypothetical protein
MTEQLKSYLQKHRAVIEAEQFDTLLSLCPLNSKKELILFLLDCNENDPSIIKIDHTTKIFQDGVQVYFPEAHLVYTWVSFDKKSPHGLRSGTITYIAVVNGQVVEDRFWWGFDAKFIDLDIIAENVCEDLATHIKVHLND